MWAYTLRRILYAIPIALGVTVVCFSLVYLAPGDPVAMLLPPDASFAVAMAISRTARAACSARARACAAALLT